MRFSLRWLLIGTAYFALVAAASVAGKAWLIDVVWSVAVLALCYAIVVTLISTGRRRAIAVGFVVFATAYLVGWLFFSDRVPVMIGLRAAGYFVGSNGDVYEPDPANPGAYRTSVIAGSAVQVANAVGMLAAGIVGCLVGRLAYRSEGDGK